MNNLFNQKILEKKADEEVDLSKNNLSERREALNKWINLLENGVLEKSKEEEFQGEFLYDIFTTVLHATNKSDGKNEWNLERETTTQLDGQKADGVLGFFDKDGKKDIRAVIELKGAKVPLDQRQKRVGDTRTPVEQAFNYAPKYGKNCQWVIVSNYKEIRLYRANDMTEYQVFFLKDLRDDLEFKKFIYVLSFFALVGTDKRKAKTLELSEEYQKNQSEIEKKFYNEYKEIRLKIFENIRKNNPTVNENILIEKVQKLLDRFLFICFCEDKRLLPNNSYEKIVQRGEAFGDIFESFKMLCNWINIGSPKNDINKFNGGLFKSDDILDTLIVDDEVFKEMEKISLYDFDSEMNENILGHIFEQSINDIEELKKSLSDEEYDAKKSKRKKDGIFYTPKYITKYIVENSIKNWLDDKRHELGEDDLPRLTESDMKFDIYKKNYTKNYRKHVEFWEKYREAVRNIKIVDPACGSGAFLITAFEYLLNYNNYLDEKILDLIGVQDLFSDKTKEILQNNIFGVDLNRESIEITKLSLWLKTANKNKTLATLENNIKCGNSLIDDPEIAGELAFDWEKEFPEVFENGGFDIVIGNPPYVNVENINEKDRKYYFDNFENAKGRTDLYILFIENLLKKLKLKGILSFIIPNGILKQNYAEELRKNILENYSLFKGVNFEYYAFEDAIVKTCVLFIKNRKGTENDNIIIDKSDKKNEIFEEISKIDKKIFKDNEKYIFDFNISNEKVKIKNKIEEKSLKLEEICLIAYGVRVNHKKDKTKPKSYYIHFKKNNNDYKNFVEGKNIQRYYFENYGYLDYRPDEHYNSMFKELFENEKLMSINVVSDRIRFSYDIENTYNSHTIINIVKIDKLFESNHITAIKKIKEYNKKIEIDLKYILAILNSKLTNWYFLNFLSEGLHFYPNDANKLLIKEISLQEQQSFIEKADKMLALNKELQEVSQKFQRMIMRKFELEKLSTKLQNWYLLNFDEFIKELKKAKIKLSLSDEANWEDYFIAEKEKADTLNNEITKTDKEIDKMVYELYGLSDDEIKVIKES